MVWIGMEKKKTHEEQDAMCECFMKFIESEMRPYAQCVQQVELCRQNDVTNLQHTTRHSTPYTFVETSTTTQPLSSTHRSSCWAVQQPEQGNESSSSTMDKIIHFFALCIHNSVVSRCPQNMLALCVCVYMLRMHELRIQSNLRSLFNSMHSPRTDSVWRKLYCCTQLKPSISLIEREREKGPRLRHNLVCKIAVSIVTAIHTTFHSKIQCKVFFSFISFGWLLVGDDAKFNNRLKWKLFFPRSNDTIRITSSIYDEQCVHNCFQRIKCTFSSAMQTEFSVVR